MSVLSATVTLAEKNEKKYTIYFIIDTYLTEDEAEKLVHSQTSAGIVKVKDSHAMPEPSALDREGMVLNREEAPWTWTSRTAAATWCRTPRTFLWSGRSGSAPIS
ncbi:unnamed protein product [Musa acuminata var. zebrina]